jgi:imidazolonepropionase-like amidohydrolase
LISVNRQGHDIRRHATAEVASDLRLSPSGSHIAFASGQQIYITVHPATGGTLDLDAGNAAFPVVQVSSTGGSFLNWSATGDSLSWSVGPMLETASVADAFVEGFSPPQFGDDLSQSIESAAPATRVALMNARIITMNGMREVIEEGTLLIDGNRIETLGTAADITVPPDYLRVDLRGMTVVPGFIDVHAHAPFAESGILPEQNWALLGHLALGVTTLHDPASQADDVFAASEYARAGRILSPRIFSSGDFIYGARSPRWSPVEGLDDALAHVRRLKAQGAISIKNYAQPRREQRQQIIEAARLENLISLAEANSFFHTDMNFIADGISGIEHNLPTMRVYDDVMQFWGQADVGLTPTLGATYGGLTAEDYYYQESDVWRHPILANFVPPQILQARAVRRPMAPEEDYADAAAAAVAKRLLDSGILVNNGGHGQREGLATHWEMWSLSRGGFTPMEALSAATINAAKYLGLDLDLGSLEPGKLADVVVLEANPLEDIRHSDTLRYVMLNGRLYEARDLSEKVTGDIRLQPFHWQRMPQSAIQ